MLARARPAASRRRQVALPTLEDQLVHLVAHGMVHHAFLCNGRFLLRDLVEQALLTRAADPQELERARGRFAAVGLERAWDVSAALAARCLPESTDRPARRDIGTRLLVDRMLLQQRSPMIMALLGPIGWSAARTLGGAAAKPAPAGGGSAIQHAADRLLTFRRKTRW